MSEVVEPVHMGPAVIEGVNELMCDHSGHMGLLVDVILTQNDLQTNGNLMNVEIILRQQNISFLLEKKLRQSHR